jgi:hypothetical protein
MIYILIFVGCLVWAIYDVRGRLAGWIENAETTLRNNLDAQRELLQQQQSGRESEKQLQEEGAVSQAKVKELRLRLAKIKQETPETSFEFSSDYHDTLHLLEGAETMLQSTRDGLQWIEQQRIQWRDYGQPHLQELKEAEVRIRRTLGKYERWSI